MQFGPTVEVSIGVHAYLARNLATHGKPVPAPIVGAALIDTGATVTTIDVKVAETLGLSYSGVVQSLGIGGSSTGYRAPCQVSIKGLCVNIPRAHCHPFPTDTGLLALIGRDILRHMILTYDGLNGAVTLALPLPGTPPQ